MSQGVSVTGGNYHGGNCLGAKCSRGKCRRGYMSWEVSVWGYVCVWGGGGGVSVGSPSYPSFPSSPNFVLQYHILSSYSGPVVLFSILLLYVVLYPSSFKGL